MILELRSLVGLTSIDDAIPEASEADIEAALMSSSTLRSVMEKIPQLDLTQNDQYEDKPNFDPEPTPTLNNSMRFNR
jgi:hypothetical protein